MKVELPQKLKDLLKNKHLLDFETKKQVSELLAKYLDYRKYNKLWYYQPDPVFEEIFARGSKERVRGIIAANRCGKTYNSTYEVVCHLTGIYPSKATHGWDWEGIRYDRPINCWVCGVTSESIHSPGNLRDLLFGPVNQLGTGWIPRDHIVQIDWVNESKGVIKEAVIRHASGGTSTVGFRVYSQGSSVLMGANLDLFLIDECPKDPTIFPQLMTRIQKAQDQKGRGIIAATPEFGLTELVAGFYEEDGQYRSGYCPVTVWDVSHITPEQIEQMKKDYPKHQWDMRLKGIPRLGSGAIYPFDRAQIEYRDVQIEKHWKRIQALDFGWNHPAACVSAAYDPDTEIIYVYRARKQEEWDLPSFAAYINSIGTRYPVVYPHDGANSTQAGGGAALKLQLQALGCNMREQPFSNPTEDNKQNNSVEAGLSTMRMWFKTGKLKIHANLAEVWQELLVYYYNDRTGKPNKINDDLMDAMRYAVMSVKQWGVSDADVEYETVDWQNYVEYTE